MSLYSSMQLANNALIANQIGLQVVGQNIANANTPGYIREEVILTPSTTQKQGGLLLGLGVEVTAVIQKLDRFLETRLRNAISDTGNAETQEQTYLQMEQLLGELSDTDLSTSLNNFFNSISEVLNQPESISIRNLAVLQGGTLTEHVRRLSSRAREISRGLNDRVISGVEDVNRLTEEIRTLNIRIAQVEGGRATASDAVGLRDQRLVALTNLAKLVDVNVIEQPNGTVSVYTGGDFLVLAGERRELKVVERSENGLPTAEVRLVATDSPLHMSGGELAGLTASRDTVVAGFLRDLDEFTETLIFEFNKIYAGGQGLTGFETLASEFAVEDANASLDAAGLHYTPVNGNFEVLMYNSRTGLTQTTSIRVDLNGFDEDTSLQDLADSLGAIDGLSAEITSTGKLTLQSNAPDTTFAFRNDTSGVLAALGLNTFFTGTSAADFGVSNLLSDDPSKFAASRNGVGEDSSNAVELAGFLDRPLESGNGESLAFLYDRFASKITQASTVSQSVAEGFRVFQQTLEGEKLATSGVSLDEEAVKMITYQRSFQASARYIATLSELLEILVSL